MIVLQVVFICVVFVSIASVVGVCLYLRSRISKIVPPTTSWETHIYNPTQDSNRGQPCEDAINTPSETLSTGFDKVILV